MILIAVDFVNAILFGYRADFNSGVSIFMKRRVGFRDYIK